MEKVCVCVLIHNILSPPFFYTPFIHFNLHVKTNKHLPLSIKNLIFCEIEFVVSNCWFNVFRLHSTVGCTQFSLFELLSNGTHCKSNSRFIYVRPACRPKCPNVEWVIFQMTEMSGCLADASVIVRINKE